MAKLTALLTLNTAGFQSALKHAKSETNGLKNSMSSMSSGASKGFSSMGGAMKSVAAGAAVVAAGVAAAGAAVGALTYKLLLSGEAANSADARVRNIAKSMGLFGDQSDAVAERLNNLADKIELQTGMDGNAIQLTQAKLLTFKELANTADELGGNFDRATQAAVDMAAAGFGAAEQNAVQLGKALNDPINGLAALRKSGITFTEEEQAKIKTLAESNRMHEAQALVLAAIETPISPPSGPIQWLLQGPPAESNLLAAILYGLHNVVNPDSNPVMKTEDGIRLLEKFLNLTSECWLSSSEGQSIFQFAGDRNAFEQWDLIQRKKWDLPANGYKMIRDQIIKNMASADPERAIRALISSVRTKDRYPLLAINPHFPALRSDPMAPSGASRRKQPPSSSRRKQPPSSCPRLCASWARRVCVRRLSQGSGRRRHCRSIPRPPRPSP